MNQAASKIEAKAPVHLAVKGGGIFEEYDAEDDDEDDEEDEDELLLPALTPLTLPPTPLAAAMPTWFLPMSNTR